MEQQERPRSLQISLQLMGALLAVSGLTVVLTRVLRDDLVLNWARGHGDAREIVSQQGLTYLIEEQPIAVPQFFAVAGVLFIVMAALVWVLAIFYAHGHHWARVCLTSLFLMSAVATGAGIRVSPPLTFLVLSVLALALVAALLVAMWHPATSAYLRATKDRVHAGAV